MKTFLANKRRGLAVRWLAMRHALPVVRLESLVRPLPVVPPPIREHICMPPFIGDGSHDDYTPLISLARHYRPQTIVELGTAHGNTTANLCVNCPSARVFTVNAPVETMTGTATTYSLRQADIGIVYRQQGCANRVTQIYANTLHLDLARNLGGPVVDLAIIDACHDTDYVLNDFRKVLPFMSPRGLVLFHDTHPSMKDHLAGSYIACLKLRSEGFDVRHLADTWWGIWFKTWPTDADAAAPSISTLPAPGANT